MKQVSAPDKPSRRLKSERLLGIAALLLIAAAWFAGVSRTQKRIAPYLKKAFPEPALFEAESADIYSAWKDRGKSRPAGYVAIAEAHGYGGKMTVAAAVDLSGRIRNVVIVEHRETASFFRRVENSGLRESLAGKKYSESFQLGKDVDTVTGATLSSRALTESVRKAARKTAEDVLGLKPVPEPSVQIHFGTPEILLILLFALGFTGMARWFPWPRTARWVSMLAGLIFLGFIFNQPLTLAYINKALLGMWPRWQIQPYWYLLLGGIFLTLFFRGRNPYCRWFCPFGAAQECLGWIGGMKKRIPVRMHKVLRWLPRGLALFAVAAALYTRNPSRISYEVFGAMFQLVGTDFIFILLGVSLAASLFLHRPWCKYLCPLRPAADYVLMMRQWLREKIKIPAGYRRR